MIFQQVFEAVCEVCGIDWNEIPRSAKGLIGKVARELVEVNATPEEIRKRADVYAQRFNFGEPAILTPTALLKHWASLKPEIKQAGETSFQLASRLAKERGLEPFRGAAHERPETQKQFIDRVLNQNVVKIA